jgi:hypothetical protein
VVPISVHKTKVFFKQYNEKNKEHYNFYQKKSKCIKVQSLEKANFKDNEQTRQKIKNNKRERVKEKRETKERKE